MKTLQEAYSLGTNSSSVSNHRFSLEQSCSHTLLSHHSILPSPEACKRLSQPNLNLQLNQRRMDRRFRMSQPALYSTNLSSAPNSNSDSPRFLSNLQKETMRAVSKETLGTLSNIHSPRFSTVSRRDLSRNGRRQRFSQPTLVTGDYYPINIFQQRLSQPVLGDAGKDFMSFNRLSSSAQHRRSLRFSLSSQGGFQHLSKRERLSQLDFGAATALHRAQNDGIRCLVKSADRDRFSIPESKMKNDLREYVEYSKQRFSLDNQLNSQPDKWTSILLPIASSPTVSPRQDKLIETVQDFQVKSPTLGGLKKVLIATTSPILPLSESYSSTAKAPTPEIHLHSPPKTTRQRLSVPEIRSGSHRWLLDPPQVKQRHSITTCIERQDPLALTLARANNKKMSLKMSVEESEKFQLQEFEKRKKPLDDFRIDLTQAVIKMKNVGKIERQNGAHENFTKNEDENRKRCKSEVRNKEEPVIHIQRHYAYTYEVEARLESEKSTTSSGKVPRVSLPKKKYLESNFDENERVITSVIEREVPLILSSPKYMKKTHAYGSEPPKWIKKYLDGGSLQEKENNFSLLTMPRSKTLNGNVGGKTRESQERLRISILSGNENMKNFESRRNNPHIRIDSVVTTGASRIGISNFGVRNFQCSDGDTDTESEPSTSI